MSECVLWEKARNRSGYGLLLDRGVCRLAHTVLWERANGPLPEGHQLHHLCHVPSCVNLSHLELVTRAEHGKRHWKERCHRGHVYAEVGVYLERSWRPKEGKWRTGRRCKRCHNDKITARRRQRVAS